MAAEEEIATHGNPSSVAQGKKAEYFQDINCARVYFFVELGHGKHSFVIQIPTERVCVKRTQFKRPL